MTADQRAANAREYLASVRQHKVTALPPSVLVRECAELRRQLGQVLDAIGQIDGPEGGRLAAIRGVLDAFDWEHDDRQLALERIEQIAGGSRTASGTDPGGTTTIILADLPTVLGALAAAAGCCERHLSRPEVAAAYRSLGKQLGDDR